MIFGERLKQVRELNGLTQTELASRLGITQSSVAQFESGRLSPSDDLLDAISLQTRFPPSFFKQPPDEDFPLGSLLFRAKAATTSREETRGYRYAQIGYRIINRLLQRVKAVPLRLPMIDDDLPSVAADITRAALGLSPDQPIGHLINTIERGGVIGIALPVKPKGIDAFSLWVGPKPERPLLIASLVEGDGARFRWSSAHEIGHLVMHHTIAGAVGEIEREANEFAAQFLMPEQALREELDPPITLSSVASLKPRWGVSMAALIMRASDLGIITLRQRKYLFQQLSMRGWRTREPPNLDVEIERPQTLPQLASLFYGDPIDCGHLAIDMNLHSHLVEEFLGAHGGVTHAASGSSKILSLDGTYSRN